MGNMRVIVFLCAFFSIQQFADIYRWKMGIKTEVLLKTLWGDFYLNFKAKRIMTGAQVQAQALHI